MDPTIAAMAISALGSLAGSILGKKNSTAGTIATNAANQYSQYLSNRGAMMDAMRMQEQLYGLQNKYQQRFWESTFRMQNARQDYLNRYSATIQKNALRAAGLSAASLNDAPFGTAAVSGATGAAVPGFSPITMDLLAVKNAEAQLSNLQAGAEKTKAEAEKIKMENANYNEWYNLQKNLIQAQTDVQKATEKYTTAKNQREWRLITPQIKNMKLQNDILSGQKTLQELEIEAKNKYYDVDGKQVKGSEIENFSALFQLEVAAETLAINWYNAFTNRESVDNDPRKSITKILQPLAESLSKLFEPGDNKLLDSVNELIEFLKNGDLGNKSSLPRVLLGAGPSSILEWWQKRQARKYGTK